MIKKIVEETGAKIDIDDSGKVFIAAVNSESAAKAIDMIHGIVADAEVGKVYTGKVTRLMNFGAFVEILPGKEGLVHISQLSTEQMCIRDRFGAGWSLSSKTGRYGNAAANAQ